MTRRLQRRRLRRHLRRHQHRRLRRRLRLFTRSSRGEVTMIQNSSGMGHQIILSHEQTNEHTQWSAQAKRAVRSKHMSKRSERMSERTGEWPSTHVLITGSPKPSWRGKGERAEMILPLPIFLPTLLNRPLEHVDHFFSRKRYGLVSLTILRLHYH